MSTLPKLCGVLLLAVVVGGCAMVGKWLGIAPTTPLRQVSVVAELNANQNSATALDLVFVYDDTARGMLPKTGPEWFSAKAALLAGLALSLDVVPLQIPPASPVANVPLPARHHKAIAVYSYANYIAPAGQPVGNLTPYKCVQIRLRGGAVAYENCS
jgi:type VI secretion system protein